MSISKFSWHQIYGMRIIQSKYMFLLFPGILTLGQLWSDFRLTTDLIIFQTYHVNVYDVFLIVSGKVWGPFSRKTCSVFGIRKVRRLARAFQKMQGTLFNLFWNQIGFDLFYKIKEEDLDALFSVTQGFKQRWRWLGIRTMTFPLHFLKL